MGCILSTASSEQDIIFELLDQGSEHFARSNFGEAINTYNEILSINPQSVAAFWYRGQTYEAQGNLDAAMNDYNAALGITPRNADILNGRGYLYQELGQLGEAISDFNAALDIEPQHVPTLNNRGTAYQAQGNLGAAIDDFTKALGLAPQNAIVFCNRASTYQEQGNWDAAIPDYLQALEINPKLAFQWTMDELKFLYSEKPEFYAKIKHRLSFRRRLKLCEEESPEKLEDPIYNVLFNDPRILSCGHTFNKKTISNLKEKHQTACPCCQQNINPLDFENPIPNLFLKNEILEMLEALEQVKEKPVAATLEKFKDPYSHKLIQDPRILRCGHTFDKESILELKHNGTTQCPCCRKDIHPLDFTTPTLNLFFKQELSEMLEQQPKAVASAAAAAKPSDIETFRKIRGGWFGQSAEGKEHRQYAKEENAYVPLSP